MNKKIERYQIEIRRTREKIADQQRHLKELLAQLKREEDLEMVKSLRSRSMDSDSLYDLLNGIQDGSIRFYRGGRPIDTGAGKQEALSGKETDMEENEHGKVDKRN